ncbi:MAG: hypothetical protein JO163_20565 [Methylobacteriaceae bacterium]|nr:hypothetical protein [Methylobacteriaceae bacterium]MBV9705122.1 hypothetical protein [Methylobacteriaceae bacterium]
MNRHSFVHIVCSPRPRVGKTLAARLLIDYFLSRRRAVVAFDTNPNEPILEELFPDEVTVADIRAMQGQVALFDGLLVADDAPKVVDLWHRVYDRFFTIAHEIGFFEEARHRAIEPLVFFIDDPDPISVEAHRQLRKRFQSLKIVSVRGAAAGGGATARPPVRLLPAGSESQLVIPPLDPILRRAIEARGFSLATVLKNPPADLSIVVGSGVRAWTTKVFAQLQNFELRQSLSDAEYLR